MTDLSPSLLVRIGGIDAVSALVDSFYSKMDNLPEARTIRAMHAADLTAIRDTLKRYLTEWMGGPRLYTPSAGHPRLRMRHMPLGIGSAERDAWLACMRGALNETIVDKASRDELDGAFTGLADWMRNQPEP